MRIEILLIFNLKGNEDFVDRKKKKEIFIWSH